MDGRPPHHYHRHQPTNTQQRRLIHDEDADEDWEGGAGEARAPAPGEPPPPHASSHEMAAADAMVHGGLRGRGAAAAEDKRAVDEEPGWYAPDDGAAAGDMVRGALRNHATSPTSE